MGQTTERVLKHTLTSLFCAVIFSFAGQIGGGGSAYAAGPDAVPASKMTRFIVGLDRHADFNIISLTKPNRVVVELENVQIQLPPQPESGPIGLVSGFHGGQSGAGKSRIVINVTEPVVVTSTKIEPVGKNFHLNVEISPLVGPEPAAPRKLADAPFDPPSALGATGIQPPMPQHAVSRQDLNKRRAKQVIVLDPGHGGHDSGAKKNGAVEKDVVLDFALTLRDKLVATGRYTVLMTRDKDEFIELGERRKFAERNNANLFIAIHADYANSSASGATIYSLRDSVASKLKKSAVKSVGHIDLPEKYVKTVDKADGNVIGNILSDLAQIDVEATKDRSDLFSRSVIQFMGNKTSFRAKPHRTAAFKVLKTHLVPSVLIELAYVTNKADAERLKSEKWRNEVSGGIASAIDNYFSHQASRLPVFAGVN
ncbi:MAG: N-acetylmuramoyl-L-alanine amidase [Alphaproteobacteria bacterium]|nr:N-acetylmuramoyl-L-alanine amidase [Alphaproteobacteria bacterium]